MNTLLYISHSPSPPQSELDFFIRSAASRCEQLHAILLEDESLRQVAAFPFAKEILKRTAVTRNFNRSTIDEQVARFDRQLHRSIQRLGSTSLQINARLEIQGQVSWANLLQQKFSMLAVSEPVTASSRRDSQIETLYLLYDGSSLSNKALQLAAEIVGGKILTKAIGEKNYLLTVVLAETTGNGQLHELERTARNIISKVPTIDSHLIRFLPLSNADAMATLKVTMSKFLRGLWIIPNSHRCFQEKDLADLLPALKVPLLLIND